MSEPTAEPKPADPVVTPPESRWLGVTASDWVKMIVPLFLGVVGGYVGWLLTTAKPHLTVKVSDTVRFQGERYNTAFTSVSVTSDGTKEVEGVECEFPFAGVLEAKVTPSHLKAVTTVKDGKVAVVVPLMNPGETLDITAYTNIAAGVEDRVSASVRAKGVRADPYQSSQYDWKWMAYIILATLVLTITVAFVAVSVGSRWGYNEGYKEGRKAETGIAKLFVTHTTAEADRTRKMVEQLNKAMQRPRRERLDRRPPEAPPGGPTSA